MGAINYRVQNIDLATVRSAPGERLALPGVAYDAVTVLQLPAGAIVGIRFGDNKDLIPLLQQGQTFRFKDACDNPFAITESLYVENPAGAGIVILLISFAAQDAGAAAGVFANA